MEIIILAVLLIVFLAIAVMEQIFFFRKIAEAIRYFTDGLSKRMVYILSAGLLMLTVIPAVFAFTEWFIIEMHVAVFLLLSDLAAAIAIKIKKVKKINYPAWCKPAYRAGAAAALLTLAVFGYAKFNMYHVIRTDYDVTVNKKLTHKYNVALIADLHYGISLNATKLQKIADEISDQSPDLVILCGDIVDESTSSEGMREAFSILGGIDSKLGVYYVYGNHDKSQFGSRRNFTPLQLAETISGNGITVLEDHVVMINDDLLLVGRADRTGNAENRKAIKELLKDFDKSKCILVADHQPNDYFALRRTGCDVVVSGHTHGGQIFPFGFFADLIKANDMTYGLRREGALSEIVTSGIAGWGFDLRTEHHSEYVMIHIRKNEIL